MAEQAAARGEPLPPPPPKPTQTKQRRRARGPEASAAAVEQVAEELRPKLVALRMLATVDYGMRVLLEPVWERIGLKALFEKLEGQHAIQFPLERLVFGMVLNRLVDPQSKLACNDWLQEQAYFPEAKGWQVQHFYRALDLVHKHEAEINAALLAALSKHLSPEDLNLLLLDTTSLYFESDYNDVQRAEIAEQWKAFDRGERPAPLAPRPQVVNRVPTRMQGHSKDDKPGKPQVVVATACTQDGFIAHHRTYPGNTSDATVTLEMLAEVALAAPGARPVVVFDAGMRSEANLRDLRALDRPVDWICAVPLRKSTFGREAVIGRPGRYTAHPRRKHVSYRAVRFTAEETASGLPEMWITTRNRAEQDRQIRQLERHVAAVRETLAKEDSTSPQGKALRDLLAHRTRKRLVKTSADGTRFVLDEARVKEEQLLAGLHLLQTTLVDRHPLEVLDGYQQLLKVEANFKTFKGPMKLRPMHHRLTHRIEAHVTVCVLALICLRELERKTGLGHAELHKLFGAVHATLMEQGDLCFWQRNEWSDRAVEVMAGLGISEGPRTWGAYRPSEETDGP